MNKNWLIIGLLLLLLALGGGYFYQQSQEASFLNQAETALADGLYAEAILAANQGLVIRPQFAQQHVAELTAIRAQAHFGTQHWAAAIADFEATSLTADSDDLLFQQAQARMALHQYDQAMADLDAMTEQSVAAMALRGEIYQARGDSNAAYTTWLDVTGDDDTLAIALARLEIAQTLRNQTMITEAAEALLALDDSQAAGLMALGIQALRQDDSAAALDLFSQVDTDEARSWIALSHWLNGQTAEVQALVISESTPLSDAVQTADLAVLNQAVSDASEDAYPFAVYIRGHHLLAQGRFDAAVSDASLILATDLPYFGFILRGQINAAQAAYPQALFDFDQAVDLQSGPSLLSARAQVYYLQADYPAARADANAALSEQPDHLPAVRVLAQVAMAEDETDQALDYWTQLLDIDENNIQARAARASLYFATADYQAARDDDDLLLATDSDNGAALQRRGESLLALGDYDGALVDLSVAAQLDPDNAYLYALRAAAHRGNGDLEAAVREARRALQFDDELSAAHLILGLAALEREEFFAAVLELSKAIEGDEEFAEAYGLRSEAYFFLNDTDRARADAKTALELDEALAQGHIAQAFVHAYDRDWGAAIDEANQAVDLAPDDVRIILNRGIIYLDGGDYNAALDDFNLIIDLDPTYELAYVLRAESQIELQRYEDALDTFVDILALEDANPDVYVDFVEIAESRTVDLQRIPEAAEGFRTWEDTDHQFAISYPEDWLQSVDPGDEFPLLLLGPLDKDYRANFNLIVLEGLDLTTSQLSRAFDPPSTLRDFEEIEQISYRVGGRSGIRSTFTWTALDDRLREIPVTVVQVYLNVGDTSYIFAATMRTEDTEKYGPIFDAMLESFAFTQ